MLNLFYGWYLKCQSHTQTLAVIPALHQNEGKMECSIQIITDEDAYMIEFPAELFQKTRNHIYIGDNRFGKDGIQLAINTLDMTIKGQIYFGPLSYPKYDIMGPFAFVPFMECRHGVFSMRHLIYGQVFVNGQEYFFQKDWGYWEGDWGRSFPKEYIWTQCCFPGGSLMLAAADIPMGSFHFTGVIGFVLWQEKEYRIATYLGAKVSLVQNGKIHIVQGNLKLEASLLKKAEHSLKAPQRGNMTRTIYESASCRAFYKFKKDQHTLFAFQTEQASFEYEYSNYS